MNDAEPPSRDPPPPGAAEDLPRSAATGWWILPSVLAGAGLWIGVFVLIF